MQQTLHIGGKPIRLDVHEPAPTGKPTPAILLMHGSGGNTDWWSSRIAPFITGAGVALFSPHYFDRTGTTRADFSTITDGVHVPLWLDTLAATLTDIAARPTIDPTRIAIVGVSLGSFLSLAYAAQLSASPDPTTRHKIRCLVDLSGGLVEPYASQATTHFPPTLILHGDRDTIVPVQHAYDLDAILTRLNVPHETHILPDGDHWLNGLQPMDLLLKLSAFMSKYLLPPQP